MNAGEGGNGQLPRDCRFRLMRLVRETQCEVEVVKPVLDELEVLRLCRSFGVMSSVNPKDFEFGVLQAGEFDEDVIPFLRNGLFGEANNSKVKFKAVFGKQNEVASALVAMGACSAETAASLKKPSEGVYCAKIQGGGGE